MTINLTNPELALILDLLKREVHTGCSVQETDAIQLARKLGADWANVETWEEGEVTTCKTQHAKIWWRY
jgi:hypothetical protein